MAKFETLRGQKRLRPESTQGPEASGTPVVEQTRKRPRLEEAPEPQTVFGKIKSIASSVWGYFVGQPRTMNPDNSHTDNSVDDDVSIISEISNSSGRHMETIQASEPSLLDMVAGTDKDEVQLVKVVNPTKGYRGSAAGPSTSLGRFYGASYTISTKEKRDKEKEDRKSSNVIGKIRRGITPPKSALATFPPWTSRKLSLPIEKPGTVSFKRTMKAQRRNEAIYESYKLDDLEKYKKTYQKVMLCPESLISRLTNSMNRGSTPRRGLNDVAGSPFFPKKKTADAFACGAVTKVQLSEQSSRALSDRIQSRRGVGASSSPQQSSSSRRHEPQLILLDHDDEDVIPIPSRPRASGNDADVIEIIDAYSPPSKSPKQRSTPKKTLNSLEANLAVQSVYKDTYLDEFLEKYDVRNKNTERLAQEEKVRVQHFKEINEKLSSTVEERLRKHLTITEVTIEEPEEEEEEEILSLPEITPEMESVIKSAMTSGGQVLVDAFNIPITRKDLETFRGLNWLNDEVINFYMQMIVERSQSDKKWPSVYATNTFFYPKLLQSGYAALKRWTRKIDIFAHDLILIPVHLGMHWCLAVVNFKKPGIYYYDSMGGDNHKCLEAIEKYLQEEHMEKKKSPFDTSNFEKVNVKNIPRQMNGSDCGMFACKFAEYLSRNAAITFTQDDMPYFRRRMIYEIVKKTLLHP